MLDKDQDGFLNENEFLKGMAKVFVGTLDQKLKLTFKMYDCDGDGKVTRQDVRQLMAFAPIFKAIEDQIPEAQEQMAIEVSNPTTEDIARQKEDIEELVSRVFGEREFLTFDQYKKIIREDTSEMLLAMMQILH